MDKRDYVCHIGILLMCIVLIWMMFQPLMSAYSEGVLASGEIYVYGIGFLMDFGFQGLVTVIFPFLMLILMCTNMKTETQTKIITILIIVNGMAYAKTWFNAKNWLMAEVNPEIKYYVFAALYPCMMIITAVMLLLLIRCYNNEENEN